MTTMKLRLSLPFVSAWIVMLALGALGHEFNQPKMYVSYWFCFICIMAIEIVISLIRSIYDGNE